MQSNDWIIDSGTHQHMTDFETPEPVGLGDGCTVSAIGVCKVKVTTQLHNGERVVCWMTDVLHVPKLINNFIVHAATSKGNTVSFKHNDCCIWKKNRKIIGTGLYLVSSKSLIVKCNSYQPKTLQLLKGQYKVPVRLICGTKDWHMSISNNCINK